MFSDTDFRVMAGSGDRIGHRGYHAQLPAMRRLITQAWCPRHLAARFNENSVSKTGQKNHLSSAHQL